MGNLTKNGRPGQVIEDISNYSSIVGRFAYAISTKRKRATRRELYNMLAITKDTYYKYLRLVSRPDYFTLTKLERVLQCHNVPPDLILWVLFGEGPPPATTLSTARGGADDADVLGGCGESGWGGA